MSASRHERSNAREKQPDALLGRKAARLIFHAKDDSVVEIEDPFTRDFAKAAIREFSRLYKGLPGKVHKIVEGARISATSQNVDQFHGITEMVQNADDQGATSVSIALRGSHLLLSHDGARVEVHDVLPLALPFLSTKTSSPWTLGRFGIGLKTLDRVGLQLEVHSSPYHFAVRGAEGLDLIKPAASIPGVYDPTLHQTLFDLRLNENVDLTALRDWLQSWDSPSLIFLRHVKAFRIIDATTGGVLQERRLIASEPKYFEVEEQGEKRHIEEVQLEAHNDARSHSWRRYTLQIPTRSVRPAHKAVGEVTPISIAVPMTYGASRLYIGLPTRTAFSLPFSINAQFEPTTDRESLTDTEWNEWLITQFRHLLRPLALHLFFEAPALAWNVIPLFTEVEQVAEGWLRVALGGLIGQIHEDLRTQVRIPINGISTRLSELVFEAEELEGLLSTEDQQGLRPKLRPIPLEIRDNWGRWRVVLYDLEESSEIAVREALGIFGWEAARFGTRKVSWCISLAAAAIRNHVESELVKYPCVVTRAGQRTRVGAGIDHILVRQARTPGNNLANYLDLTQTIHEAYLSGEAEAATVCTWLERSGYLVQTPSPQQILTALHTKATKTRMELSGDALRMLRDLLSNLEGGQLFYGTRIGSQIWVDGYRWQDGKRVRLKVHPAEAYQSQAIDRSPQAWAHAAGETPDLVWLDPSYRESLSGDRGQLLSPTRFFTTLGARTAPRLVPSPSTTSMRGEAGYSLLGLLEANLLPSTQKAALERLPRQADTLLRDYQSPDLTAVIRDIASTRVDETRQKRARALLAALSRSWEDGYAKYTRAQAAYSYYVFNRIDDVPATWIADAASIPWMSNYDGEAKAPSELIQTTADNILVHFHHRETWAAEISPEDNLSEEMLKALGIQVNPYTYRVVEELEKLREATNNGDTIDKNQPRRLYEILARRIPNPYAATVGGMKSEQLKSRFGSNPEKPGLVFVDNGWHSYKSVFLPPRIFQNRRPFVVDDPAIHALWEFLGIRPPSPQDCVKVLQEIAAKPPAQTEHSILLDTYRHLENRIGSLPATWKRQLSSLPLWTTNGWRKSRPIYAIDSPALRRELAKHIAVWEVELPSTLPNLALALKVTVLKSEDFRQISTPLAAYASQDLAEKFALAIQHFRDRLADRNPELYHSCSIPWPRLVAAQVWLMPELMLEAEIPKHGKVVISEALAHMEPVDFLPTFYFRDAKAVGDPEAGGAIMKSLFPQRPSAASLDAEWFLAWNLAQGESQPRGLQLAERVEPPPKGHQTVQVPPVTPRKTASRDQPNVDIKTSVTTPIEPVHSLQARLPLPGRQLKSFREFKFTIDPNSGGDTNPAQMRRRTRHGISGADSSTPPDAARAQATGPVLYTAEEREDIGAQLLALVLRQEFGRELHDYRRQPHVGADLKDDTGHYYELKVHGLDMPNEVTLQDNELERAWQQRENYTLVVISGVERGAVTKLKFFEDPLQRLDWKTGNSKVSLTGILSKQGDLVIIEEANEGIESA